MLPLMQHEIHQRFESLFNSSDVDGLLAMYVPDAVLGGAPGTAPARGHDQIRPALFNFFAGGAQIHMETVVSIEYGDTLFLQAKWRIHGIGPNGIPFAINSTSAEVLRRGADGEWRFIIDNPFAAA